MSWLQRGLFGRKRSESTPKEETAKVKDEAEVEAEEAVELVDAGPMPADGDLENVDTLFARMSVVEMRKYEQNLQAHIENTRRQMRKVAGEHYPDLINAADSVVAMDTSSANISKKISDLKGMLSEARGVVVERPSGGVEDKSAVKGPQEELRSKVYSIAAQVKVLVDTPEQIWKALESKRFLQASLLYMIAREIHKRLSDQSKLSLVANDDDENNVVDPLLAFPVIERQWASVTPFREQIITKANLLLSTNEEERVEAFMNAICAIALLEDVDAEMACTVFLSRRAEAHRPLLDKLAAGNFDGDLETSLQNLLGQIRQMLTDYMVIFGVPGDDSVAIAGCQQAPPRFASWILTTLASLAADADLPMPPSLRPLWQGEDRRQQLSATSQTGGVSASIGSSESLSKAAVANKSKLRRRKSSIAGSVISSAIPASSMPVTSPANVQSSPASALVEKSSVRHLYSMSSPGLSGFSSHLSSSSNLAGQHWANSVPKVVHSSGIFMVSKYLPEEVAQYKPPVPRILDVGMLQPDGDSLNEADEDMVGLEYYMRDTKALLKVLASQIQPCLERAAKQALEFWWQDTIRTITDSVSAAIESQVARVGDAARIGAAIYQWEMEESGRWTRGFSWSTIASSMQVLRGESKQSLYASVVEPLLRDRARMLQNASVDLALSSPQSFLLDVSVDDILAGHITWQALRVLELGAAKAANQIDDLVRDVSSDMVVVPAPAQRLGESMVTSLQTVWGECDGWWRQMNGAAALPEALVCLRHFEQQWQAMCDLLGTWSEDISAQAMASIDFPETADLDDDEMPYEVMLCIKGAWTMGVLVDVARRILASDTPLVRECWTQLKCDVVGLTGRLQEIGRDLLSPWYAFLGSALARSWADKFDALYYRIPSALQRDSGATHRDVVRAWLASTNDAEGAGAWSSRYASLRRIATTTTAVSGIPTAGRQPRVSSPVLALILRLEAQIQAVNGLGSIVADKDRLRASVGRSFATAFAGALDSKLTEQRLAASATTEWDKDQLRADMNYMESQLAGADESWTALMQLLGSFPSPLADASQVQRPGEFGASQKRLAAILEA
ncbi:hypothetical protein FBU59_000886 [Linderina macrospora]|uniref:Uncharacterized protein n=1 Tax=Linderina macrospora TaxID=4868 RepID=A0ACC1JFK9_9FUNG|nr:hypothetical protein FBU59_000886 [Linderina macrospora]